ncbi:MAG: GTPase, partial [Candidatus Methanomethylophilaceae archaeon]|nr:GTPase [Candidatus Methanomethylophilaceae archaeon]
IVEPTGLALPHKVKELVKASDIDEEATYVIGVVDVQRFEVLVKKKEQFFTKQMSGADFILINKCDLATDDKLKEIEDWMASRFPEKKVLSVSAKEGTNMDKVYELMK